MNTQHTKHKQYLLNLDKNQLTSNASKRAQCVARFHVKHIFITRCYCLSKLMSHQSAKTVPALTALFIHATPAPERLQQPREF